MLSCDELLEAIHHNELAGAILDVCEIEPIPEKHPIWEEKKVLITPHISGTFQLPETKERFVRIMVENMYAYANGKLLKNVVDMKSGYRTYRKEN